MKKAIFKFYTDYGRMGHLEGILISTQEKVDKLVESGIEVYFGEVLGKHSEIYGSIDKEDIKFVSDNEEAVRVVEENDLTSGLNPFHYTFVNFELEEAGLQGVDLEEDDLDDMSVNEMIEILLDNEKK